MNVDEATSGTGVEVRDALINILTTLLTGSIPLTATSVLVELLKGIDDGYKEKAWVKLFNRETRKTSARLFQFGHVFVNESGELEIELVAIELETDSETTGVFFIDFKQTAATFKYSLNVSNASSESLMAHSQQLREKLHAKTTSFIAAVEI